MIHIQGEMQHTVSSFLLDVLLHNLPSRASRSSLGLKQRDNSMGPITGKGGRKEPSVTLKREVEPTNTVYSDDDQTVQVAPGAHELETSDKLDKLFLSPKSEYICCEIEYTLYACC